MKSEVDAALRQCKGTLTGSLLGFVPCPGTKTSSVGTRMALAAGTGALVALMAQERGWPQRALTRCASMTTSRSGCRCSLCASGICAFQAEYLLLQVYTLCLLGVCCASPVKLSSCVLLDHCSAAIQPDAELGTGLRLGPGVRATRGQLPAARQREAALRGRGGAYSIQHEAATSACGEHLGGPAHHPSSVSLPVLGRGVA